jgi:WD40 repeat protein
VLTASFSPTGDRIVTGSEDNTARVWSADGTGEPLVLAHRRYVVSAAFSPGGDRVLTTSQYYDARIWRVTFEALGAKIREVTAVCLDPDFRERTLQERNSTARAGFDRCRRCVGTFSGRSSAGDLENAFRVYRRCFLPALQPSL